MTQEPENEAVIGTVVSPFGIKGEVKVFVQTDHPERFYDLDEVTLRSKDGERATYKIEGVRFHKGAALIKFQGCNDMNGAEELRGSDLVIPDSQLIKLPENEYYIHDLIGLRVFTVGGRDLGEITEVLKGVANDAYVTEVAIIPALKQIVRDVDIAGRKMIVELPEGWTE
ncbi:MAG: ribosome maturation factor RimM [Armatimonadota bacterium]|nr:ribosome maturation factor RimM [Armatimonadota bacterium]